MSQREILFKAKKVSDGKWVEGYPSPSFLGEELNIMTVFSPFPGGTAVSDYKVDPSTVCQYTGLKDKNGVKIFEGDIVNFRTTSYMFTSCKVVWETENAMWSAVKNDGGYRMSDQFEYLVIGNIHEN